MTSGVRGPLTYKELTAGLVWPLLWRAVPQALHPARLLAGTAIVVLLMALGWGVDLVRGGVPIPEAPDMDVRQGVFAQATSVVAGGVVGMAHAALDLDPGGVLAAGAASIERLARLAAAYPFTMLVIGALWLGVWTWLGGAISRMVVVDIARGRSIPAVEALSFAGARWRTLMLALLTPLLIGAFVALVLMAGGFLLLRWPVVDVLGGAAYGLFILGGAIVVLIGVGLALVGRLLIPAVAAESSDASDAIQRAYAYLLGRSARLVAYLAFILVYGAIALALVSAAVALTLNVAAELAFAWTGREVQAFAGGHGALQILVPPRPELEGATAPVAAGLISVWERAVLALVAGFAVSYHFAASSIVYLLLRRVNDEQDVTDIWLEPDAPAPAQA